jgi:hypothetical protein
MRAPRTALADGQAGDAGSGYRNGSGGCYQQEQSGPARYLEGAPDTPRMTTCCSATLGQRSPRIVGRPESRTTDPAC